MNIRPGQLYDHGALEDIQFRASTVSPRYRDAILRHPDAVCLDTHLLTGRRVRVAEAGGFAVGFSVLLPPVAGIAELDGLFVDPPCWRQSIGSALMLDAMAMARAERALAIEVTANLLAQDFYAKLGFTRLAEVQTRFDKAWRMSRSLRGNSDRLSRS
jgi:ribosomal protein S18 acetylase RimI-like enzyme